MSKEPESIWIDRGPLGGWMFRTERLHDSVRQYVPADRIEALEAENERLREALEESLALNINYHAVEEQDGYQFTEAPAVIEAARAALEPKP